MTHPSEKIDDPSKQVFVSQPVFDSRSIIRGSLFSKLDVLKAIHAPLVETF